jgi:hypothetical protein
MEMTRGNATGMISFFSTALTQFSLLFIPSGSLSIFLLSSIPFS